MASKSIIPPPPQKRRNKAYYDIINILYLHVTDDTWPTGPSADSPVGSVNKFFNTGSNGIKSGYGKAWNNS
jgi:hypothetical protein